MAGSSIANWYADGCNYHSDGLPHEPKRTHLNRLHELLAQNQEILLSDASQIGNEIVINNNVNTFAYEYTNPSNKGTISFLYNMENKNITLKYKGNSYIMPNESVSIIDSNGKELYNSAKINKTGLPSKRVFSKLYSGSSLEWWSWIDDNTERLDEPIMNKTPLEQLKLSNNTVEQMYYSTDFTLSSTYSAGDIKLKFVGYTSCRYMLFINDEYIDTQWDYTHDSYEVNYTFVINMTLKSGDKYTMKILSVSQGMDNRNGRGVATGQGPDAQDKKGLIGSVVLVNKNVIKDLTENNWAHLIGLSGESLNIAMNPDQVAWKTPVETKLNLAWYKTSFKTQSYNESTVLLIDIGDNTGKGKNRGLNRGRFYLNGVDMGHYNNIVQQNGLMVQRYYYIPRDMLNANGHNTLMFFEEIYDGTNLNNVDVVLSNVIVP